LDPESFKKSIKIKIKHVEILAWSSTVIREELFWKSWSVKGTILHSVPGD
jgi:hypothetical protein